ncbi:hypothetical protein ISF_03526 [Cordyceps fumosorosea ARSEF 2679]|uniref:Uncharacterized protein n=1 Tax=Cordyceps fumosorosea (strain ARSEF 2679) TaxID=1081104 RepID=A0A168ASX7_CORFA|nr:hypothetical protein ISF_03526 [Cordyceps fumosorosea ARSEF 2679]OAA69151.1 hypothetical protein ISF_03526 [Cordyceps fumosorosea ARSEF 2679]
MPRKSVRRASTTQRGNQPTRAQTSAELTSVNPSFATGSATETEEVIASIASLTLDTPLRTFQKPKPKAPEKTFPLLSLPSELRIKIYEYFFADITEVLDLTRENHKRIHKRLGLMRTCRLISNEATHLFYSTRTFRLFPTSTGRYFKTKKPLLARLSARQRQCLTKIEMRLGPGWSAPPPGWVVNAALGLKDCIHVHTLSVYVEVDPSDNIFNNFRRADGFYEEFSRKLLAETLKGLPAVRTIEFDAYESVQKRGAMMRSLFSIATASDKVITWGPDRGWVGAPEDEEPPTKNGVPNRYLDSIPITGFTAQSFVAVA